MAVPGDRTTAYLLFRLWSARRPPARIEVVPFHEIMPGVAAGRYDAGLVIHEARFTYHRHGLTALVDLGEWWERDTGLPIPLGAILARRGAVDPAAAADWVRESVRQAWADPAASREYVLAHAQEMEPDVVDRHIGLYVNDFTADLGDEGLRRGGGAAGPGRRPPGWPLRPPARSATAWTLSDLLRAFLRSGKRPRRRSAGPCSSTLIMSSTEAVQLLGRPAAQLGHRRRRVEQLDPHRLRAPAAVHHAEVDPLAGLEVGDPRRQRALGQEHVAALVAGDEAVSLGRVVPLHSTRRHLRTPASLEDRVVVSPVEAAGIPRLTGSNRAPAPGIVRDHPSPPDGSDPDTRGRNAPGPASVERR